MEQPHRVGVFWSCCSFIWICHSVVASKVWLGCCTLPQLDCPEGAVLIFDCSIGAVSLSSSLVPSTRSGRARHDLVT